jgi:glutamate-ammonia-ligase adenylyltransferase
MDWAAAVAQIAFRDPEAGRANLARLDARVPPGVAAAIPTLLAESPDPDSALNLFERLTGAPENHELLRRFDRSRFLVHYAIAIFGYSPWLGETLVQNTDLFASLGRDRTLDRSHSREDFLEHFARFRSRSFETEISQLLARFKKREYIRIMLRDVLGIASLAETTAEISALSDVLIEEARRHVDTVLRNRYGVPRHIDNEGRVVDTPTAVLSMGKLGGNELNYSSDVDLLFLYGDGEADEPGEITNREYFIRLAQQVTEVLSRVSREGAVFRIDLRLRPQGAEGEPAVPLGHAIRYYAGVAHDWELQALIKLRHSAGDLDLAREFIRAVQHFVYREELNFAAIETAVNSREKIGAHRRKRMTAVRRQDGIDVKLDRGGIRDIEFLVQCLQRVYGGTETWLRSGGTLFSLQKLHDKGHISGKDFHELSQGYAFLRTVEHRLQLRRGQQVHRLPNSDSDLHVLYRSVTGDAGPRRTDAFVRQVGTTMGAVAEIYERIIHHQQTHQRQEREGGEFRLAPPEVGREQSYEQILKRLAADAPALYAVAAQRDLTTHTRRNLQRFLSAAFTSSERYAALVHNPQAVGRALRLFQVSDYLTDILVRHPQELGTIEEIAAGAPGAPVSGVLGWGVSNGDQSGALFKTEAAGAAGHDPVFGFLASAQGSRSDKLGMLRQHYRHRMFAAGSRDVMELRPVYESLAEMSAAADGAIAAALAIAGEPPGFAVLTLGRLGSWEFDLASDADLLFVRDEQADSAPLVKVAEQVVEALAAYTQDGTLFPVDLRLRPRGAEGELLVTPESLAAYFASEAQPWEALTYSKLRYVVGSEELALRAMTAVEEQMPRFSNDPGFAPAIRAMRAKLEKSGGEPNFKVAPGGAYDIDYIVSYLLVNYSVKDVQGNTRDRLHALAARALLSDDDCATLDAAAELLRTIDHVVRLVTGRRRKSLPVSDHPRQVSEQLVSRMLGRTFREGLARELERTYRLVRPVYQKVLGGET